MKKRKIIIGFVILFIITILLGRNSENVYVKKKHFNNTNELLHELESDKLKIYNNNGSIEESDNLKECLSKRKRLTYSGFEYSKIEIKEVINLDDKSKNSILDDYYKFTKNYLIRDKKINSIEPIKINAKVYDYSYSYEENKYDIAPTSEEDYEITLVAIDEGEGLVIDYVVSKPKDEI